MNVTVLTYVEEEGSRAWDAVVDQVVEALRALGHAPTVLAVHADLPGLATTLTGDRPDLVFNLIETFAENDTADIGVAGLLLVPDSKLPETGIRRTTKAWWHVWN